VATAGADNATTKMADTTIEELTLRARIQPLPLFAQLPRRGVLGNSSRERSRSRKKPNGSVL
jgi:hypothetical protein